ncbi:574_t:CDS:1, partial [Funneliformis geosporum]
GCGREKKKKINKPADDLIQEIQEQAVVADEFNKIFDFIN